MLDFSGAHGRGDARDPGVTRPAFGQFCCLPIQHTLRCGFLCNPGGDVNTNYPEDSCDSVFKPSARAHRYLFLGFAGQLVRIRATSINLHVSSSLALYLMPPGSDTPIAQADSGPPICVPPGCLATSAAATIPPSGTAFTLPATGPYVVEAAVTGFGNYTLSFLQAESAGCDVSISPRTVSTGNVGGSYSLEALTSPGCSATPSATAPWIHVQPDTAIAGYGTFAVQVDANPGQVRSPTVVLGNRIVPVDQQSRPSPGCTYNLDPVAIDIGPSGGMGHFTVSVGGPGPGPCHWQAYTAALWLTITPASGTGSATLTYVAKPNFCTTNRVSVVPLAGQFLTIAQQAVQEPPDWRFVRMLYYGAFGRWPSTQEVAGHVASIAMSGRTATAINFMNATEYNLGSRFIAGLYVGLLGRDAEYSGWWFHRARLSQNLTTQDQLVEAFLGSAEYSLKYPGQSSPDFIRMLYRQVLVREPTQAEVDFHVGTMAAGLTRVKVARNFLNSPEFRIGVGPRLTANLLYFTLLHRDSSVMERNLQIQAITGGVPLSSIVAAFIGSSELQALFQ